MSLAPQDARMIPVGHAQGRAADGRVRALSRDQAAQPGRADLSLPTSQARRLPKCALRPEPAPCPSLVHRKGSRPPAALSRRSRRLQAQLVLGKTGRKGLKDEEIIVLLRRQRNTTFFTRDAGFYLPGLRHRSYCRLWRVLDRMKWPRSFAAFSVTPISILERSGWAR